MNIAKMMQQAKAMQDKMQNLDAEMANIYVEGIAGGGAVKTVMSCKGQCQSFTLDPSVVNASDKDMLEDLIVTAINDAKAKADARVAQETQAMMSSLGLPAGVKLPF
jgi:hypothetical protein